MSELKPPPIPLLMLHFFAQQPDFAALAGDMGEEFYQRARASGWNAARRWYWREAVRNAWALTLREVLRAPLRTTLIAVGCLLAVNMAVGLYVAISVSLFHRGSYRLLLDPTQRTVLFSVHTVGSVAAGWIGGRLLRGREWALALTYTLVFACSLLPGTWYFFTVLQGDYQTVAKYFSLDPGEFVRWLILGNALRLGGFWLGCLWSRGTDSFKTLAVVGNASRPRQS